MQEHLLILKNKSASFLPGTKPFYNIIINEFKTPETRAHVRDLFELLLKYQEGTIDRKTFDDTSPTIMQKLKGDDLLRLQEYVNIVLERLENELRRRNLSPQETTKKASAPQKNVQTASEVIDSKPQDKKDKFAKNRNAAKAAMAIYNNLNALYNNYVEEVIDLKTFQVKANAILSDENSDVKELKTHRGFKEILVNLAAAIMSIGVTLIVSAAMGKGLTLFSLDTDSSKILKNLGDEVHNIQVKPK